jgi:prephenate dehydratase
LTHEQEKRIAFQGEPGAFSEAAAVQLLGDHITTVPRATFDELFHAIPEGAADALLAPVENSLAGSVVRVYDLLVQSGLQMTAETILPIEHHLIGCPGASLEEIRVIASHPVALAQCERFLAAHPMAKRLAAEDTAGSVRAVVERGDKSHAAIAARRAADKYGGVILEENIHDNAENFTRFVLLQPPGQTSLVHNLKARKMSLVMRLAHRPGALRESLGPFSRHGINLLKIESRPIHGRPWEYQFFVDVEAEDPLRLQDALADLRAVTSELHILGLYAAAKSA